ncbi:MAG TPA: citrate synthase [Polyangiaceae bacterium]|nr:citrate synthase [Polyangiaceae bacterium]
MSSRDAEGEWLSAKDASELLRVQRATLYAYVSRGLLRARAEGTRRSYARSDLEALRVRSAARRGHGAVAGAALLWGEPVLDTRISRIEPTGPRYRGHPALDLVRKQVSSERVAELLWGGELPSSAPAWPAADRAALSRAARLADAGERPLSCMLRLLVCVEPSEEWGRRGATRRRPSQSHGVPLEALPAEGLDVARTLLNTLSVAPALGHGPKVLNAAQRESSLAAKVWRALGGRAHSPLIAAVDTALVLLADHELNASTFAARVAAGAGADLARCLLTAHATLSGGRHGGLCDRLEHLLSQLSGPEQALAWLRGELAAHRGPLGFGHPLYPNGDPRAAPLFALADQYGQKSPFVRTANVLREAMLLVEGERPTVDLALVSLTAALGLPAGSASAIFALGRSLGYVAHVLEQREQGHLLRPRANYLGA